MSLTHVIYIDALKLDWPTTLEIVIGYRLTIQEKSQEIGIPNVRHLGLYQRTRVLGNRIYKNIKINREKQSELMRADWWKFSRNSPTLSP